MLFAVRSVPAEDTRPRHHESLGDTIASECLSWVLSQQRVASSFEATAQH
jgi:hypothetical protein